MKVLYFGGQKSGKSLLAEEKTLQLTGNKMPFYLATYNNNYHDDEMNQRVKKHQTQRQTSFLTIEEPFDLRGVIEENESYLVDCLSMWLLNNLEKSEEELLSELDALASSSSHIVFVLNSVNEGVIPLEKESRKFVDLTGIIGQKVASFCDEVYEVKLGIEVKLK
jgi:adenosylcobinamide kinase/adenosylcobinamide-phosphate guanylyltransferase